jgi:hypothetical protein
MDPLSLSGIREVHRLVPRRDGTRRVCSVGEACAPPVPPIPHDYAQGSMSAYAPIPLAGSVLDEHRDGVLEDNPFFVPAAELLERMRACANRGGSPDAARA